MVKSVGPQHFLRWSSAQIFQEGDHYFESLLTDIRQAQKSIAIEVYIFELDPLTREILEELGRARARGCQVFIMVDGFGSLFWLSALERETQRLDLTFRIYRTMPRTLDWFRRFFFPSIFKFMNLLRKLNHRNHRKIVVIDETIGYVGSINFTQVHSKKFSGEHAWKDAAVRLTGGSVPDLYQAFWLDWKQAPLVGLRRLVRRRVRDKKYRPQNSLIRLNTSSWARFWLYRNLLRRIKMAEKRIWIETAYFLPRMSLMRSLRQAVRRGVQVEIIIPHLTDVPIVKLAAEELVIALTLKGVKIHEYMPRILHSKIMIIDDWATIGSHNWNHRSFLHDLEVEAIFTEETQLKQIKDDWLKDRADSQSVTSETLGPRNLWQSFIGRLAFRLRYLL